MSTPEGPASLPELHLPWACIECDVLQLCMQGITQLRIERDPQILWRQLRDANTAKRRRILAELKNPQVTPDQADRDYRAAVASANEGVKHCINKDNVLDVTPGSACHNELHWQAVILDPLTEILAESLTYQEVAQRIAAEAPSGDD